MEPARTDDETPSVDIVLWLGALRCASGSLEDPFPADLEIVATRYFAMFQPPTKA